MTAAEFRRLALSLPETQESSHMGHPDFRVRGKIFATLGYPDAAWGMVNLTPEQQQILVRAEPSVFVPVKGAWGRQGSTTVRLAGAGKVTVRGALLQAWRKKAPKSLANRI
jgi:hypothetical protein